MEVEKAALIRAIREKDELLQVLQAEAERMAAENQALFERTGLASLHARVQALEQQAMQQELEELDAAGKEATVYRLQTEHRESEAAEVRRKYGPDAKLVGTRIGGPPPWLKSGEASTLPFWAPVGSQQGDTGAAGRASSAAPGQHADTKRAGAPGDPESRPPAGRHVVSNAQLTPSTHHAATWMHLEGHLANVYPITRPPGWPPEGLAGGSLNFLDIDRVHRFGPYHRHGREPRHWTGDPRDAWYTAPEAVAPQAYPASTAGFF